MTDGFDVFVHDVIAAIVDGAVVEGVRRRRPRGVTFDRLGRRAAARWLTVVELVRGLVSSSRGEADRVGGREGVLDSRSTMIVVDRVGVVVEVALELRLRVR